MKSWSEQYSILIGTGFVRSYSPVCLRFPTTLDRGQMYFHNLVLFIPTLWYGFVYRSDGDCLQLAWSDVNV